MDLELLRSVPLFSWLPERGPEVMDACFDLETEDLTAGESRLTDGRVGCLLRGSARFETGEDRFALRTGELLGLTADKQLCAGTVTAEEDCTVLWFQYQLVCHVCYRACWDHARAIQEIDRQLAVQFQK